MYMKADKNQSQAHIYHVRLW